MEQKYLIDTNIIIDNFGNKLPEKAAAFLNSLEPVVSVVTKIEVLGWLNATDEQLKPLYVFMEMSRLLPIDDAIIKKTISIRQTKKIGLGDALIAATAIVYDQVLITHNVADFKNISGLKVIDPYTL
jgi:predicted nucleic acid-binding protein